MSGLNIDKMREFPTRKMETDRPKKPGGRVISRAVGKKRKNDLWRLKMMFWAYTIVICITLLPLLFIIWIFKEASPKYYGYLLSGGFLIVCSACAFWTLTEIRGSFFTEYPDTKSLSSIAQNDYKQVVASMELWIYLFPSVLAAVGVNLITDFIKIRKPDNVSGFTLT